MNIDIAFTIVVAAAILSGSIRCIAAMGSSAICVLVCLHKIKFRAVRTAYLRTITVLESIAFIIDCRHHDCVEG